MYKETNRSRGQVIDLFTKKSKTCPSDLLTFGAKPSLVLAVMLWSQWKVQFSYSYFYSKHLMLLSNSAHAYLHSIHIVAPA